MIVVDKNDDTTCEALAEPIQYIDYNVIKKANSPKLTEALIPVKWNGENWVKTTANDITWYNYDTTNKNWANAVTIDQTRIIDYSYNNNYGTIYGATQQSDGLIFDGIDDYVDAGLSNHNFKNAISLVVRFKLHAKDKSYSQNVFGNWESGGGGIYVNKDNYIYSSLYINGGYQTLTAPQAVELNKFYTVVLTFDGTNVKLYVNGTLENVVTAAGNIGISAVPFAIGTNINASSKIDYGNITVSDVSVYNKALSDEEVKTNFSNNVYLIKNNLLLGYKLTPSKNIAVGTVIPMDNINTIWVLIPRYAYKITNRYHESTVGSVYVKILIDDTTTTIDKATIVSKLNDDQTSADVYVKHPAFTLGNVELPGLWVSKFEASGTTNAVDFKPNVSSFRSIKIGDMFDASMNMETNSRYGWGTSGKGIDTH